MEKTYFTYNQIHNLVKSLAGEISESGFRPDVIVAIGGGGFIPARMMRTFIKLPIVSVSLSYYDIDNNYRGTPQMFQWLESPETQIQGKSILVVDEVDDTRATIAYCLEKLNEHLPSEMGLAVLHNKAKEKAASLPDYLDHYFIGEDVDDKWLCYPWDAVDILKHDNCVDIPE